MGPAQPKRTAATQPQPDSLQSVAAHRRRAAVNARAAQQWGVLRHTDLRELGLSGETIRSWTAAGHLHHPFRACTPWVRRPPSRRRARSSQRSGAVETARCSVASLRRSAGGFCAIRHRGCTSSCDPAGDVARSGSSSTSRTDLPPDDVTAHEGVPVTTIGRTLSDLAAERSVSDRALESAAAHAERDGRLSRAAQLRTAARARARHRTGSPRLRTILRIGPRLWRSDEEAKAAIAIVEAGLPEPVVAHVVPTDIGPVEVDLSFPDHKLILEIDGGQHDLTLNAARDVDHDAALARLGWATLRVSARDVRERPASVVSRVRAALAARGHRP